MYTQCPDCDTAFRVTAEVLKQAAGQVRCGGCGNAFNALAYLSEEKPARKKAEAPEPVLPELKPEPDEDEAPSDLPSSVSAEQSAALLKTLDELAGSDIRIEDTGVEWRVFADADDNKDAVIDVGGEQEEAVVDELLEEAPTPVDQFLTATPNDVEASEIFAEPEGAEEVPAETKTSVDELRFDDNTPLPDDFDFDDEPVAPLEVPEEPEAEPVAEQVEEPQVDLEFGDSDEWESLLDEVDEEITGLEADQAPREQVEAEPETEPQPEPAVDEPMDLDTQFATQAEAMGIDLSGIHEIDDELEDDAGSELEELLDPDIVEADSAADEPVATMAEDLLDPDIVEADSVADEPVATVADGTDEPSEELGESLELDLAEADEAIEASTSGEFEALDIDSPEDDLSPLEIASAEDLVLEQEADEHHIPPMSEEEQTINMQIDQDLLAFAMEDDHGFASTIVKGSLEGDVKEERKAEKSAETESKRPRKELFETIVMEGETFRDGSESEKAEDELAEEEEILAGIRSDTRQDGGKVRGGRRRTDPPSWAKIAAAIFLVLVLIAQVLHQSRETLATYPLFHDIAGPLYRLLGRPLTPSWDVTGWNFEISKGAFDEAGENLTIYSRIGNRSDKALPYPLISVSLTDRFEETIGNKVLEPAEYLESGLDPRKAVDPGNKFNAAITIATRSPDATGFKLNVCYRVQGGRLRCDMQDFK